MNLTFYQKEMTAGIWTDIDEKCREACPHYKPNYDSKICENCPVYEIQSICHLVNEGNYPPEG